MADCVDDKLLGCSIRAIKLLLQWFFGSNNCLVVRDNPFGMVGFQIPEPGLPMRWDLLLPGESNMRLSYIPENGGSTSG